jgi:hypothetical protein
LVCFSLTFLLEAVKINTCKQTKNDYLRKCSEQGNKWWFQM